MSLAAAGSPAYSTLHKLVTKIAYIPAVQHMACFWPRQWRAAQSPPPMWPL